MKSSEQLAREGKEAARRELLIAFTQGQLAAGRFDTTADELDKLGARLDRAMIVASEWGMVAEQVLEDAGAMNGAVDA